MSIPEILTENILTTLSGAGVLVTGLSAFLGRVWSKRILMREKGVIEGELQEMRSNHEKSLKLIEANVRLQILKKDQFHQISKSTFESIFNRKIELYSDLLKISVQFRRFAIESIYSEIDDPTDEFWNFQRKTRELIENNRLYVSEDLFEKYVIWYEKAVAYFKAADIAGYEAHGQSYTEEENLMNVWDAQHPEYAKLVKNTNDEFVAILDQIEKDIDRLRKSIEIPLNKALPL
ncbi:hypothetical protein SAMN02746065_10928 [Desulfocicer vacuolatum DSM 3385]|uniref:Uncharacterized protein n=1 Tax=Desulfocicer vacuolatum DSM 3385 TaxID=1121400 RepID=A0A1W2BQC6_9BACT|nr:hypothetical protein [Desulfocicer vacuolatum]SMC74758.1 hypothetical protein SAMN02746065_10928 [Desulfocicer vacuolatum DSM 3385]